MSTFLDDPVRVEAMARAFEGMTRNVARLTDEIARGGRTAGRAVDETGKAVDDFFGDVRDNATRTHRELDRHVEDYERTWRATGERIGREMKRQLTDGGMPGAVAGLTGPRGLGSVLQQTQARILGQLPMGGLLGLMIYGRTKDLEYEATATRIGRVFDKVGGIGRQNISSMTGELRAFAVELGSSGEEVQASAASFAEYGLASEIFERAKISVDRFGGSILSTATAQDQLFRAASGTTGKLIGEVYQSTGEAAGDAADSVFRLGIVSQQTRTNYEQLASTMLSNMTTLRLQRQGADDLAASYLKVRAGLAGGGLRGMNEQAVNAAAMRGVSAIGQGLSSLPEGLMAVLGEQMSGGKKRGLDAIYDFKEGLLGDGDQMGGAIDAIRKRFLDPGSSRSTQLKTIESIFPGMGFEGARAIVDYKGDAGGLAEALKNPQERMIGEMKAQSKLLKEGFDRQYREEPEYSKTLRGVMDGLAHVGSGLLEVVTVSLVSIQTTLAALGPSLKIAFYGALGREYRPTAEESRAMSEASLVAGVMDKGFERMGMGFDKIFGKAGALTGALSPELAEYLRGRSARLAGPGASAEHRAEVAASNLRDQSAEDRVRRLARGIYGSVAGHASIAPAGDPVMNELLFAGREGAAKGKNDVDLVQAMTEAMLARFKYIVDADPGVAIKLSIVRADGSLVATSAPATP